ncbi:hypothetical protein N9009_00985 [bacterium]|nr:hypothetical protein [bacterium]
MSDPFAKLTASQVIQEYRRLGCELALTENRGIVVVPETVEVPIRLSMAMNRLAAPIKQFLKAFTQHPTHTLTIVEDAIGAAIEAGVTVKVKHGTLVLNGGDKKGADELKQVIEKNPKQADDFAKAKQKQAYEVLKEAGFRGADRLSAEDWISNAIGEISTPEAWLACLEFVDNINSDRQLRKFTDETLYYRRSVGGFREQLDKLIQEQADDINKANDSDAPTSEPF